MKKSFVLLALSITLQTAAQNAVKKKLLVRKAGITYISDKEKLFPIDENTITVRLKPGMKVDNRFHIERQNKLGYIDIQIPDGYRYDEFAHELNESGRFDIIEYNSRGEYYASSNDPYSYQQWYLGAIGVNSAWNITMGSPNIKVAVLDSGVDYAHSDLGYGNDSYKNIDELLGWNFETDNNSVNTGNYHGTMVAGVIGAKTNNLHGISGITGGNNNSGVTIIPYCIGASEPITSIIDDAIVDAVDKGAKVINLCIGISETTAIEDAIVYAYSNNVTIVCATGNNNSSYISYPASNQYTIAVGAMDVNYQRWIYSRYGIGLDLIAPGVNIYSSTLNNNFAFDYGTSFAAPQVSGTVALMLSVNSTLTPNAIKRILQNSAQKITGYTYTDGWNNEVGYGLLDAFSAVNVAAIGTPPFCMSIMPVAANGGWGYWRSDMSGNTMSIEYIAGVHYPSYEVDLYKMNSNFSLGPRVGHWVTSNLSNMTFGYYPQGWYSLQVVGVNDCGSSYAVSTQFECRSGGGGGGPSPMFSFSYSQDSELLTVRRIPATGQERGLSERQSALEGICEIQLWNGNSMLRSIKSNDEHIQIPMSGMKAGLYVVRAIINGLSQQQKLLKK